MLGNHGTICWHRGDHAAAIRRQEQAALHQQASDRFGQALTLSNLADGLTRQGHFRKVAAYLWEALSLFRQIGDRDGEAHALNNLGVEAAARHGRLALARAANDRAEETFALNGLGEAAQAAGHHADAVAHHGAALSLALKSGDR